LLAAEVPAAVHSQDLPTRAGSHRRVTFA
jgi:hypothetical protein